MTQIPVLALPDFYKNLCYKWMLLFIAWGLLSYRRATQCVILVKTFAKASNSSTYVRELHAIPSVVQKWHQYLLGRKFLIEIDQKSIKELMTQVIQNPKQHHYLTKLLGSVMKLFTNQEI